MRDLVPWLGIDPGSPALGAQSLNCWTTREVLLKLFKNLRFKILKHRWISPWPWGWQRFLSQDRKSTNHKRHEHRHTVRAMASDQGKEWALKTQGLGSREAGQGFPWNGLWASDTENHFEINTNPNSESCNQSPASITQFFDSESPWITH